MLFALVAVCAALLAVVRRVPLAYLADTRFSGLGWLAAAFALRVALNPLVMPFDWAVIVAVPLAPGLPAIGGLFYIASFLLALLFIAANRNQPGFCFILVGLALNLTVIAANGGQMPSDPGQLARAGLLESVSENETGSWSQFTVGSAETRLPFLGDVLFVPLPFREPALASIGDVIIALGVVAFINRLRLPLRKRTAVVA